ncbi:MAG TPA: BON domain-containing protein [Pyrinomonadaceae bacterium]|nr:BON domain-containing protein [Pyrinomonadaceae bacterium]
MAYDDDQARRSRVVVETPTSRREVTHTEAVHGDRGGVSGTTVGIIVVVAIALITIVVLFLMNNQNTDTVNANTAEQPAAQQPVIVQQPAQQQPPVIIQQPAAAPVTQPPVIIQQPAPATGSTSTGSQDGTIQAAIDKTIADDPSLSALGITATVLDAKVTLTGSVKSEALKTQVERAIRAVRGVKQVDNQIVAMG